MPVEGKIAEYAQGEMPLTWKALAAESSLGDSFLERKVNTVCIQLFSETLSVALQAALDERVADYAGKLVALQLIGPGIDYWGKQPLSISATGRNENKSYGARADDLHDLRTYLLEQTRIMWPEVEALLPRRRVKRVANIPQVKDIEVALTPNPYDFEAPFAPRTGA